MVIYSKRSWLYSLKERWFVIQLTLACLRHDCGGRARIHFPTNINCAVDTPAFGELTKVRIASVREENLTLDESPSWSPYHLCQISKSIMFAYHRHTALTDGAHRLQTDFHRRQQHMFICRIPSVFQEWSFLLLCLLSFCLRQTEGLAAKTKTQQPKLSFQLIERCFFYFTELLSFVYCGLNTLCEISLGIFVTTKILKLFSEPELILCLK